MKKVIDILKELYPEVADEFETSEDFIGDGLLDSFAIQLLFNTLEEEYGVTLKGTDLAPQNFASLDSIRDLLEAHGITDV